MADHQALPVQGYKPQSQATVDLVNENKQLEEIALRQLDRLATLTAINGEPVSVDKRWLAIGRTHLEQAWMAINRSVFQPARAKLPGDAP